jgi:hypothetical protein
MTDRRPSSTWPALTALIGALLGSPVVADSLNCEAPSARWEQLLCDAAASSGGQGLGEALGPMQIARSAEQLRISQTGPSIEIEAALPVLPGIGPAAAAGEAAIAERLLAEISDFRDDYARLLDAGDGHVGPPWAFQAGYEQLYQAPGFWSVDMQVYFYTGGAHGGEQNLPLVIARDDGALMPPEALFLAGSDWLTALSDYCYRELAQKDYVRDDDAWLREGTAPNAENYQALLPQEDGLHVIFGQYQIGPYAIGMHTVVVPYDAISALLNPVLFGESKG